MNEQTKSITTGTLGHIAIIEMLIEAAALDAEVAGAMIGPKLPPYQGD